LRPEADADMAFQDAVYASTRTGEIAPLPWTPAQKQAFLADQSALQRRHYRTHYPAAQFLVVEHCGAPIGRLYLERTARELRLMDIALLPACRGRGIGSALVFTLLDYADSIGLPVSLHVEPFNRIRPLYERLGFVRLEERGIYWFMVRPANCGPLS
jgi:GNAT superfamily N-acetyltransferase